MANFDMRTAPPQELISPEEVKRGIWGGYESIKDQTYRGSDRLIKGNKSWAEPDYSDSVKTFAFIQMKRAANYLTDEQRQARRKIIEDGLNQLKLVAENKKNLPVDQQAKTDEELSKWELKKEFWQKELEIFDGIEEKNRELQEELLDLEKACQAIADGKVKQQLIQQQDQVKKSLETHRNMDVLESMLYTEKFVREAYQPTGGLNRGNMKLNMKLKE